MRNLSDYDVIIFDCDGVLIDINELKCHAFSKAVENYPKHVREAFVQFCRNSFGISRYEKFKKFFSDYAKISFDQQEYERLIDKYADICKKDYLECDLTEGCLDLLKRLDATKINLFVASGSDENELNEVFEKRNLYKYFKKIYGSPQTKVDAISEILEGYRPRRALFIGDAQSDMMAAKYYNMDFIYMEQYTIQSEQQDSLCKRNAIQTIRNLKEL